MSRILISGASGLIGAALQSSLRGQGDSVVSLVRSAAAAKDQVTWDPMKPLDPGSVSGFDAVVHLAGESIVGRWTAAKKTRILESRRQGTRNLAVALAHAQQPPRVFIAASAVGYYGSRSDELLTENSVPGTDFLAQVCKEWEGAVEPARAAGIRTVNLRIGLVLSRHGGALATMLLPFRLGIGGRIGDGRQWWSWIHIADLVKAVSHIMSTGTLNGPVNMVGPNPATNTEFTKVLAAVLHRPAIFPVPAFAARLAMGEMADELLLASQRVEPAKLSASKYSFQYSNLEDALRDLLRR